MPDDSTQPPPPTSQPDPQDAVQAQAATDRETYEATLEKEAASAAAPEQEPLFEEDELRQFDEDDVTAGRSICKMLSLFFLYTVIVMAIAGYWTAMAILN